MRSIILCILFSCAIATPFYASNIWERLQAHDDIHTVSLFFSDINGAMREIIVSKKHAKNIMKSGIFFDGSSVSGFSNVDESDILALPDHEAFNISHRPDGKRYAYILCDVKKQKDQPYEADPRFMLKQAEEKARKQGMKMHVGAELEFFLMHVDGSTIDKTGYCCAENNPTFLAQKEELLKLLENHNILVEKLHHEVAPGQHEIVLHHNTPTKVADDIIMTRHLISQWAHQHGFVVDFRPKPLAGENGSALHVHFSCFDLETNTNLFFDEQETAHLSAFAQNALAEVLHNVTDLTALLNPTANSYERLQPGFEAPVAICWAMQNRSALIRIPAISHPNECRAEIRSPDSIANPYLIFAALLESTLDSISHGKPLRPAVNENIYKLSKEELDAYHITFLPASLEDALAKLENSEATHKLFNTYFIEQFCKEKRKELQA